MIEKFSSDMAPYAVGLAQQLAAQFWRIVGAGGGQEGADAGDDEDGGDDGARAGRAAARARARGVNRLAAAA